MSELPKSHDESSELPSDITELIDAVASLPDVDRGRIEPLLDRVVQNARRRRAILLAVQDSLAQLRLDMKYLMFDLEATRRERDAFRRQLD